jgi:hypothetical protein
MQPFKVTKLDAAKRQLNQAIRLWFGDGDPVFVHTLTGAAMQVISDLLKHRGEPELLFNNPIVKPEMRREYVNAVRSWANFLKHADEDPEGEIEFNPAANDYYLWHCLLGLHSLRVSFDMVEKTFWARFGLENPELMTHDLYAGLPAGECPRYALVASPEVL